MPPLTAQLVKLRKDSGLSYAAIAERAQMAESHVHRIINGKNRPKLLTLVKLGTYGLGADIDEIDELLKAAGWPGWM